TSRPSKDVNGTVMSVVLEQPDTRIIFHPIPAGSKAGLRAASIALAAAQQGKFVPMHEELMRSEGVLGDDDVRAIAVRIGADADKLLKDAASDAMVTHIYRELAAEKKLGLNMSPLFYFNRHTLFGPNSLETLRDDFTAEIKKARN
ncbi:MAG: rane protein, partial [Micavibrio sp.]|nr:rane protein [Micavibrio sp.]